jgi:hypothetical protein
MNSYNSKIQEIVNEAIKVLIEDHSTVENRVSAASLLGSLAEFSGVHPLCQALNNTNASVRISAAEALGHLCSRIKNFDAVVHLCQSLQDPVPEVVCHASIALGKIGDHSAVNILHEMLKCKSDIILSLVSAVEMISSRDSLVALTRYKVEIEYLQAALEKTIKKIQVENHYTDNDSIESLVRKISKGVDIMAEQPARTFHIQGNYIEKVEDGYHEHNYAPQANLKETEQLTQLLQKLRTSNPNATEDILLRGFQTMPQNNPKNWQNWQNILGLIFVGGVEGIKIVCPPAGIPIEVGRKLYDIYDRNRKQLPGA